LKSGIESRMTLDTYRPSQEILRLVAQIDEFKGAWRLLRNIAPERLTALRRVATIESVGSSTRIEGVKLTNAQVEALLSGLETRAFASRDEEEVAGYAALMETVFASYEHLTLTENHIQQLHGILLKHSKKDERHRGRYKTLSNNVEAFGPEGESLGIVFETASPFDTPFQMTELAVQTREALDSGQLHPLLIIGAFVVRFLAIHPFQDGNGRLSRALTTLLLLRSGYSYVPYASLESIIEKNKESYYLALRRTQGTLKSENPDWEPWVLFFVRAVHTQKSRLEKKIEREQLLEGDLPKLSLRILELARERGRITTPEIMTLTGEKLGVVRNRVTELIERGLLNRHGKARATWYTLSAS
jgi:Fic family protein